MTTNNLYLDIHVIQTVPSSNINRDDTGAPKTALYGGVSRSRVSSQSWKRAVRQSFQDDTVTVGYRTKKAAQLLKDALQKLTPDLSDDDAWEQVNAVFKAASVKLDKNEETSALFMVSPGQIDQLAQYVKDNADGELDKKAIKAVLKGNQSIDLALFGRMVADNPELNVEAAAQVAHAISTHEVVPEFDYFTALDDLQPDDTTGAAMLGTLEFNSATLYRYANINMNYLIENLGEAAAVDGAREFVKAFALSMPTGKQNTFANKTLPSYVMLTLRTDTPVNLVSGFEDPVTSKQGYVKQSIEKLNAAYKQTLQFVEKPLLNVALGADASAIAVPAENLTALLGQVTTELTKVVKDENGND
ncbi:type I-E CRISPR-associated protein Cas7/Cse4/CasC [Lactiplantibacillus pentosus]|uniref:type I-E CRISPR-associated protein Cas7/Cse4/CasC n=1 Tax=Lactiplantibacillus pentosus TaxID=1589 RepID=UPI001C1F30D3|nr:type I-E CRISPR-associated protein Cas7/Cse4/CasC [Lactiplantibacillus pentosus]MBU7497379.1 type I-E CRISPR-associated protein Cas7/Cse4/CasC [Lactiplantibacillus pentosus]WNN86678.1 type I-E CRISPR-associated protein Cas7/Cse4/CasC [Lactiplantibacillus pentosus]